MYMMTLPIRKLLQNLQFPLAIPSANISSKLSPTSAQDVFDEFGTKIKFILKRIPTYVATPFPPLNFNQIGKRCPKKTERLETNIYSGK